MLGGLEDAAAREPTNSWPNVWADSRVGHEAVIKVQVRAADAAARLAHDRVAGVLDLGHRLFHYTDPVRSSIGHCEHSLDVSVQVSRDAPLARGDAQARRTPATAPNCYAATRS